jgi:hypothetical protein
MIKRTIPTLVLWMASSMALSACGGCGDDDPGSPDAPDVDPPDAPDPDGAPPPTCYQEVLDGSNDAAPEATDLTLTAAGPIAICGNIDVRAPENDFIDADIFTFRLDVASKIRITITAPDGGEIRDLDAFLYTQPITDVRNDVLGSSSFADGHITFTGPACYGHELCDAHELATGFYNIIVQALNPTEPVAAIPYEITIETYDPDTGCVTPAGTADFVETRDDPANGNTQNDVVNMATFGLTPDGADAPEDSVSELTIAANGAVKATGVAGAHVLQDQYLDRDTYAIVTGASTNTLDIRVAWTGGVANDFDWYLVKPDAANPDTVAPSFVALAGSGIQPEYAATAVEPSTTYWLVVGSYQGTQLDLPYTVTVCGSHDGP